MIMIIHIHISKMDILGNTHILTLAAEMFGVGDFWLEIRVVLTDFHKDEAKKMAS